MSMETHWISFKKTMTLSMEGQMEQSLPVPDSKTTLKLFDWIGLRILQISIPSKMPDIYCKKVWTNRMFFKKISYSQLLSKCGTIFRQKIFLVLLILCPEGSRQWFKRKEDIILIVYYIILNSIKNLLSNFFYAGFYFCAVYLTFDFLWRLKIIHQYFFFLLF